MQFPESWLRTFCDPPISTEALAERLTMGGLEVESVRPAAPPFHGVVVAEVLAVEPHPNADRLKVCSVDVGAGEPLSIVCGAPNVRAGIKVPCARVGAELPPAEGSASDEPFRIGAGTIRGVESRGMLCSARELHLSDDHGGLLILDPQASVGADLRDALRLDDTVFTLKLTPNLGHALGVYGVARELAAITGAPLKTPDIAPVAPTTGDILPVRIEPAARNLCGRFSGRVVRGVDPKAATPAWMVERLARCGQRSVAALVDISNYVMFEYGRPTHIFDLDTIEGGLVVRWAEPGETLELLNGSTVTLDADVGVIADHARVESLAGIMGGERTAVVDTTRNVYIEAAFWWPEAVAGRARRYRFSTDAAHRFERGVDPQTTVEHIERITALVVEICGTAETEVGPIDDHVDGLPNPAAVRLRVDRAARVIGIDVSQADCERVMTRLGFQWTSGPGWVDVIPPSYRFDLRLEEDLIEEVIRLVGYDSLPPGPPRGRIAAQVPSETLRPLARLRHAMADLGWQETISYSFVDERHERDLAGNADPVRVVNPIVSTQGVMRSSLIGSLIDVLRVNLARRQPRVKVFELGKVYRKDASVAAADSAVAGLAQPLLLGGLWFGPARPPQWGAAEKAVDFYDVKGDLERLLEGLDARFEATSHPALHPGRSAAIWIAGRSVGAVGELHPQWRQSYELPASPVVFELEADAWRVHALPIYTPLPRQQVVMRDVAVVVGPTVRHDSLIAAAMSSGGGTVREAMVFDIYEPKTPVAGMTAGERSVAIRLALRDDTATLTDERIERVVADVLASLAERTGARRRAQ